MKLHYYIVYIRPDSHLHLLYNSHDTRLKQELSKRNTMAEESGLSDWFTFVFYKI